MYETVFYIRTHEGDKVSNAGEIKGKAVQLETTKWTADITDASGRRVRFISNKEGGIKALLNEIDLIDKGENNGTIDIRSEKGNLFIYKD